MSLPKISVSLQDLTEMEQIARFLIGQFLLALKNDGKEAAESDEKETPVVEFFFRESKGLPESRAFDIYIEYGFGPEKNLSTGQTIFIPRSTNSVEEYILRNRLKYIAERVAQFALLRDFPMLTRGTRKGPNGFVLTRNLNFADRDDSPK